MRMITLKENTDLQLLKSRLLPERLSAGKTTAALDTLRALNPHADLNQLRAGTVLLVPDSPAFKPAAGDPLHAQPFDALQLVARNGMAAIADRFKQDEARRDPERKVLVESLTEAKRRAGDDADLQQQIATALDALKNEATESQQTMQRVDEATKGTAAALAALAKLLGK